MEGRVEELEVVEGGWRQDLLVEGRRVGTRGRHDRPRASAGLPVRVSVSHPTPGRSHRQHPENARGTRSTGEGKRARGGEKGRKAGDNDRRVRNTAHHLHVGPLRGLHPGPGRGSSVDRHPATATTQPAARLRPRRAAPARLRRVLRPAHRRQPQACVCPPCPPPMPRRCPS